jgi:hypothetical protein
MGLVEDPGIFSCALWSDRVELLADDDEEEVEVVGEKCL